MFTMGCDVPENESWVEVLREFDTDGHLHIAVMELLEPGKFREQCVYVSREKVIDLIEHLQQAVDRPNYNPTWGTYNGN